MTDLQGDRGVPGAAEEAGRGKRAHGGTRRSHSGTLRHARVRGTVAGYQQHHPLTALARQEGGGGLPGGQHCGPRTGDA